MDKLLATLVLVFGLYYTTIYALNGRYFGPTFLPPDWWGNSISNSPFVLANTTTLDGKHYGYGQLPLPNDNPVDHVVAIIDGRVGRGEY